MKLLQSFLILGLALAQAQAKVENSFSQYSSSSYNKDNYYASTPSSSSYPDLTVKNTIPDHSDPLLTQGTAQQPVVHGAPNQHVYYYETYPMQDSSRGNVYSVPGAGGAGGNKRCTYMGNGNVRCYSRQDAYGVMNDYDSTGGDGDSSGSGLGGLAGLIGLLGLKGLKGLASVIFPVIFPLLFPLIFPLLLPIILPLLLILAIPLLLLPVPVVTIPTPAGRSLQEGLSEARKMVSGVFDKVLSADECIERISCEISRMSQKRRAGEWVEKALNYLPEDSTFTKRIVKGFSMINSTSASEGPEAKSNSGGGCSRLKCKMMRVFDTPKPTNISTG